MTDKTVKHPELTAKLTGIDGNAFSILAEMKRVLPREEWAEFADEAMQGDYDELLQSCMKWVNVE